jgi:hypothetical protein
MKKMKYLSVCRFLFLVCVAILFVGPGVRVAQADSVGITNFTGGTLVDPTVTGYQDVGYEFRSDIAITVTALGKFWFTDMNSTTASWQAKLWTQGGTTELASVNIPASNTKETVGSYQVIFQALATPVELAADTNYVIAVRIWRPDVDKYSDGPTLTYPSTGDHITWLRGRYRTWATDTGNILYPSNTNTVGKQSYFGANFKYIPEPATLVLLGLGGLCFARRRH